MVLSRLLGSVKYSVSDAWGSRSTSSTLLLALANAAAKLTAVEVLPMPPF